MAHEATESSACTEEVSRLSVFLCIIAEATQHSGPSPGLMEPLRATELEPLEADGHHRDEAASTSATDYSAEYVPAGRGRWSRLLHTLLGGRNDHVMEEAGVNHHFTPAERERLQNIESIDYFPPNSSVYRKWLNAQPHG